jgi:sterol desaturase/sphingolipid hydroxylase (fatty acid hydroxylase superfamily)
VNNPILNYEPAIRLGFFFGILILMAIWEVLAPRRPLATSKRLRWFRNLSIVLIDTLALRLLFPLVATGVAVLAEKESWGLLQRYSLSFGVQMFLGVAALDFVIYLQHAMFHGLPTLFRLHMMHHTDLDFDTSTGVRFHPIEIILSMGIKIAMVAALGISFLAVLIFEILLNATSMFNHGNVRLPGGVDRVLRLFVVTPEMHRVHHSVIIRETNSNFGFNFPWWDRLLGTYKSQPAAGHEGMTIGLSHFRDPNRLTLLWLLALPFIEKPGKYPLSLGNQP